MAKLRWTDRQLGQAIRWAIEEERTRVERRIQDLYPWESQVRRDIRTMLDAGLPPPRLRNPKR